MWVYIYSEREPRRFLLRFSRSLSGPIFSLFSVRPLISSVSACFLLSFRDPGQRQLRRRKMTVFLQKGRGFFRLILNFLTAHALIIDAQVSSSVKPKYNSRKKRIAKLQDAWKDTKFVFCNLLQLDDVSLLPTYIKYKF